MTICHLPLWVWKWPSFEATSTANHNQLNKMMICWEKERIYRAKSKCERKNKINRKEYHKPQAPKDEPICWREKIRIGTNWAKLLNDSLFFFFFSKYGLFSLHKSNIEHVRCLDGTRKNCKYRENRICCKWRKRLHFKLFKIERISFANII